MERYITVDGGTTNTRVTLIADGKAVGQKKYSVGARANMLDPGVLDRTVSDGVRQILTEGGLKPADVKCVLASGMITSEFGVVELEHVMAPAGVRELHGAMFRSEKTDFCGIPTYFIRGVKKIGKDPLNCDMMRGEECEIFGLYKEEGRRSAYVLPGTHSKVIFMNEGRIDRFDTMLTGEMLETLSRYTILKDAVTFDGTKLDEDALYLGYAYCQENGINKSLFKVRIMKNLLKKSPDEVYSFFVGAVLQGEIDQILRQQPEEIVVSGNERIKAAEVSLLRRVFPYVVTEVGEEESSLANSLGMIRIFEYVE